MADNKPYKVMIGGIAHTVMLSSEDAKRYGDKAEPITETKAQTPQNKASEPDSNRSRKSTKSDHSEPKGE